VGNINYTCLFSLGKPYLDGYKDAHIHIKNTRKEQVNSSFHMDTLSPLCDVEGWTKDKDKPNNNKQTRGPPTHWGLGRGGVGGPPK